MYIEVSAKAVAVVDAHDFTSFSAVLPTQLTPDAADAALRAAGAGYWSGDAVVIAVPWLRVHTGDSMAQRAADLDAMLDFAATKGWLVDGHVRAHVVRRP